MEWFQLSSSVDCEDGLPSHVPFESLEDFPEVSGDITNVTSFVTWNVDPGDVRDGDFMITAYSRNSVIPLAGIYNREGSLIRQVKVEEDGR